MKKISELLRSEKKWKVFGLILLVIVVIGTTLSLVAKLTLIRDDVSTRPRIAVVGPMTGPLAALGQSLKQGAELNVEWLNRQGGYKGRPLEISAFDDTDDAAMNIVADSRVIAVIGHVDMARLKSAAAIYAQRKLPVVTPLFLQEAVPGVTSLGIDTSEQARFVANYARNVVQQRLMYVVREEGAEFDPLVAPFLEVYERFETPVRQVWKLPAGPNQEAALNGMLKALKSVTIGAVYIAARPELAARVVKGIRATRNALELFGSEQIATAAFRQSIATLAGKDAAIQSHGIVAATPVLFDTANAEAQRFQIRYQQKFNASPDWLAVIASDAVTVALTAAPGVDEVAGLSGALSFVERQAQLPIQMGIYNGERMISAPVQLLPIARGAGFNYIEALRQGRVLYVNDRFMFKTNVVYVGVSMHEIGDIDLEKETATLDMSIWFRYRGSFDPQDVLIANAVEPVKLDKLEESKESDEIQYRRYRVKQKFQLNFTGAPRAYTQHVAGIAFRHRELNRNNLMYVVDVLGMPSGNALIDDLRQRKVVKSSTGWDVDSAWVSQILARELGDGAPQYVGMTGEQPLFSSITYGTLLKPATTSARDVVSAEFFIYIAIFGLIGAIVAVIMDTHLRGRHWLVQSWLLRVIFWPMLLLSVGNITLDWAFNSASLATTRNLVLLYESLWWLIGAWLFDKAIRRFIWESVEEKTQRRIPNVMKFFTSVLVFSLGFAGITAFVFNQPLTSLLATSGVLAMVVGLAVQANIANVFSGIILNIERPFKVGDYVKLDNIIGRVIDITWRTTRIESNDGQHVSLANSKVSEVLMENFSNAPHGLAAVTHFYTRTDADPARVLGILNEAVANATAIIFKDGPDALRYGPRIRYRGVVSVEIDWVADFTARYRVAILPDQSKAREQIWTYVRQKFVEQGIALLPSGQSPAAPAP